MEKEPQFFVPESLERFGQNVKIHVIFVRHGEKGESGELTHEGREQAVRFGENLNNKDAIKGYSSPVQRVVETVRQIIENSPHGKKLKTRIKTEIAIPPFSQVSNKKWKELEKQGPNAAAEWFLDFGAKRPDAETASPHEVAESFAYVLTEYLRMADKIYSGSNIDIVNGTHQGLPEALLKEVLKRKVEDKEVVGFETLEDISGALKFTEAMEFIIETGKERNKKLTLNFRGREYDIDVLKLDKLAKSYGKKQRQN